ncbi:MAG: NAD-glutamate dehydrogenase [Actinomycetota bacterium]|nr:MAG: NAD-glutamate dehydrogenase [Actinomycetota bacterium]
MSTAASEAAKDDLLAAAVATAGPVGRPLVDLAALIRRYYRGVAVADLVPRGPAAVAGAVTSQLQLASQRPLGKVAVRVSTPAAGSEGWSTGRIAAGHTVVEVVTEDMPFLVDSIVSELSRQARPIHLVVHPVVVVRRDLLGELLDVLDVDADDPAAAEPGVVVESWIHVEVDRETDPGDLEALRKALVRVLADVREAVEDWDRLRGKAQQLAAAFDTAPPGFDAEEVAEGVALLRWLADDHFTFLGYREYDLRGTGADSRLLAVPGTGLGVLRSDPVEHRREARLPPRVQAKAREPHLLVITKANSRSTVHRPAHLDYVGVKRVEADGTITGEYRFIGLYSAAAYTQSVFDIPVLRRKASRVIAQAGFPADSHSGNDLVTFLETYPRDELFQVGEEELLEVATAVLQIQERRTTRLFCRRDVYDRFYSCLVYVPRDRYTTAVRLRLEDVLREAVPGAEIDYTARVSESVLARLHFVVRAPRGAALPDIDVRALEGRVAAAARAWEDDFTDQLAATVGEEDAAALVRTWRAAFPEGYKEETSAADAVADLARLQALEPQSLTASLYRPAAAAPDEWRFKLYRSGAALSLSQVLPILGHLGVEVIDERPYQFDPKGEAPLWIYDFGLRLRAPVGTGAESLQARFEDAFAAIWSGRSEADGLAALVTVAGLTWRRVVVLRAYVRYLRQIGTAFSQSYIEQVVVAHGDVARSLLDLHDARFDPALDTAERDTATAERTAGLRSQLDDVATLDADRILRSLLTLVQATVRTSHFQPGPDGQSAQHVAIKLAARSIPELPEPRPEREIWVYSPRVEGVHLRFGPVARGGLRWSDRPEDFRTEILGLVKAQSVKNAIIVPVGAKGGFFPKQLPDAAADRDAWLAEGTAAYRIFVSALLDVTDNLVAGVVVPPPRVVRYDGDDSYLVVAADKGTATFSDVANRIAAEHDYWLGDAFASGGSVGFDHKAMGITARGAWESVTHHFGELGVDVRTDAVSCVGIGDMSGDVFGNGMLLSRQLQLVAAFDHRHVFLDPQPVADKAFEERKRLFELPRSSWADYDVSLLSAGGGIYPRTAKSVTISAQAKAVLGLPDEVEAVTPAELIRAILRAPVDLLWNGGIGTYVRATGESDLEVGDKSNDGVRVTGASLRCRVVGEGGNLGFTQRGRIEAAQHGVLLNTDAIDNSAGVDTSDHEVNIKVLLDVAVREGDLTVEQRNALLAGMTDEVARLVLADNDEQNILLANARAQAPAMLNVHQRMLRDLERSGELDRSLEFLPDDADIDARIAAGRGLTTPELAVLSAYAKIALEHALPATSLPDEDWTDAVLRSYFPADLVDRFPDRVGAHPLRREIVTTVLVNDLINRGGITVAFRAMEETGASADQVVRAAMVVREIFGLTAIWEQIDALDHEVPTAAQAALALETRRTHDRAIRWFLQTRGGTLDVAREIERFKPPLLELAPLLPTLLQGQEAARLAQRTAELVAVGAPADIAGQVAALLDVYVLLDVVTIAGRIDVAAEQVARAYFVLSDRYQVDAMLSLITALPRRGRWEALARMALRADLYAALAGLTARVLTTTSADDDLATRIADWESQRAEGLARARATLTDIASLTDHDLASLSVALRTFRTLVEQAD